MKLNLILPSKLIKTEQVENPFEIINLAKEVSRHFLARKLQVSSAPFISKQEKDKNFYIANQHFKKVYAYDLGYEIDDEEKKKQYYEELKNPEFWKGIIDYLFDNTDDRMISFYGQTFNGIVLFLEKRYYFLKNVKGRAEVEREQQEFVKQIKKWKLEEFNDVYLCLIAKIYKTYKPYSSGYKNKYYQYSQYLVDSKKSIKIKDDFFNHSDIFRGVFSHYLPEFLIILQKLKLNVHDFINVDEFNKLCENKGIIKPSLNKVDINELIEKAAREYFAKKLL